MIPTSPHRTAFTRVASPAFVIFVLAYTLIVAGIAFGLSAAGIGTEWVVAATLVMAGLGLIGAMSRTVKADRQEA